MTSDDEAQAIARRLTKAQRKALLTMPDGWVHWDDLPDVVCDAFGSIEDDPHGLLQDSEGSAHVELSGLGLRVRAALVEMEDKG